jgi:hypothetical protein
MLAFRQNMARRKRRCPYRVGALATDCVRDDIEEL